MAGWTDLTSISTPAGAIAFVSPISASTGLVLNPKECTGLGSGEVRAALDNRAGESGFIIHPEWYEAGSIFILAGMIRADVSERDALMADTKTKLRSTLASSGTVNFATAPPATVRWYLAVDFPPIDAHLKGFRFGLVSAEPW